MARMNKTKRVIALAGLLAWLTLGGTVTFAQTNAPAAPATEGGATMDHEMSNGQGGMMPGMMMPGMMMNGEMQQKMSRMMDNCSRMMESMMQNTDGTPAKRG
jgi:hypothetical protein